MNLRARLTRTTEENKIGMSHFCSSHTDASVAGHVIFTSYRIILPYKLPIDRSVPGCTSELVLSLGIDVLQAAIFNGIVRRFVRVNARQSLFERKTCVPQKRRKVPSGGNTTTRNLYDFCQG